MKLLILSDSHSSLQFMRLCMESIKPDAVIHLGDYYDDGEVLREEYPGVRLYQVPGNCDKYRLPGFVPEILGERIFGVDIYMTHGHKHNVKFGPWAVIRDARASKCQAVLYGHTHEAVCEQAEDGLWIVNPGSAGYNGGTAALMEIQDKKITTCRILDRWNLEE